MCTIAPTAAHVRGNGLREFPHRASLRYKRRTALDVLQRINWPITRCTNEEMVWAANIDASSTCEEGEDCSKSDETINDATTKENVRLESPIRYVSMPALT